MNSPFANYFLEIMSRIETEVPAIRYINQDLGQLEEDTDRPSVTFPCALIDFDDFQYTDMSYNSQVGEGNVIIRVAHAPYSNSSNLSPDAVKEKALQYYEHEQSVFEALQGWVSNPFGAMTRIAQGNEKREDRLRVRYMIFKVSYQDNSAGEELTSTDATMEFDYTEEVIPPQV